MGKMKLRVAQEITFKKQPPHLRPITQPGRAFVLIVPPRIDGGG